jgi:hypothetical protein
MLDNTWLTVHLLELALRLTRLGRLGPEAVGEGLVLGDLFLLARDFTLFSVALLDLGGGEGGVIPRVEGDGFIVDIEDVGADVVEKTVVVRNNDRTPLVGGKEFLEPTDRQDIEVVGRLVEEQTTRVCGQNLGQKNS